MPSDRRQSTALDTGDADTGSGIATRTSVIVQVAVVDVLGVSEPQRRSPGKDPQLVAKHGGKVFGPERDVFSVGPLAPVHHAIVLARILASGDGLACGA
jgi:hypothetical protein